MVYTETQNQVRTSEALERSEVTSGGKRFVVKLRTKLSSYKTKHLEDQKPKGVLKADNKCSCFFRISSDNI